MKTFGIHTTLQGSFDEARGRVTEALKAEGFGVLTEIDVKATLKKKLDVDFRHYTILGACNPPFAHRALEANLDVGLLLPCNVALYEQDDGRIHVAAIDPLETIAAVGDASLTDVAREVHDKLERVIANLAASGRRATAA
jgi:uncharacterized protein (DUF302 family)